MNKLDLFSSKSFKKLISVSRFFTPATTWIKGANVLQIYTGEVSKLNVVLSDSRIAYVGEKEPLIDEQTKVIEANDLTLVPGYVEPHAHSWQIYNPSTLSEFALKHGTTTIVHDDLTFFIHMNQENLEKMFNAVGDMPIKNFWSARLDPQVKDLEMDEKFTQERLERILNHPLVLQAGELTYWYELINGDPTMLQRMWQTRYKGLRIDTHNPGASVETLNAVAASGATSCHESIHAEEVIRRLRLGYYTTLRYSSIRPDLPDIIKGLIDQNCQFWDRMMLTTDGSSPFFLENGFIDECIRVVIESGLEPVMAYRMASLNPAVYYGLDQDVGGISPGRIADIAFLEDLRNPTPIKVMANGMIVSEKNKIISPLPEFNWGNLGIEPLPMMEPLAKSAWFEVLSTEENTPIIELLNAVITRRREHKFPVENGKLILDDTADYMYASLLHRNGEWLTKGIIKGFGRFSALASSYSISGDIIVLGTDPEQMAIAANHILTKRGGICLVNKGEVIYHLSLPLLGTMSLLDMDTLIEQTLELKNLIHEFGYLHDDPIYTLLFLSASHLPSIRLTSRGVLDIKTNEVLIPSVNPIEKWE